LPGWPQLAAWDEQRWQGLNPKLGIALQAMERLQLHKTELEARLAQAQELTAGQQEPPAEALQLQPQQGAHAGRALPAAAAAAAFDTPMRSSRQPMMPSIGLSPGMPAAAALAAPPLSPLMASVMSNPAAATSGQRLEAAQEELQLLQQSQDALRVSRRSRSAVPATALLWLCPGWMAGPCDLLLAHAMVHASPSAGPGQ
jgi:hypothetical protein